MGMFALQFAIINRPHLYAKHKMRPIVTYVLWSVCVSLLFTIMSPTKTAQLIEVQFRIFAQMGPRNRVLDRWEPGSLPRKKQHLFFSGGTFPPNTQYRNIRYECSRVGCTRYSQPYSVSDSSDAAYRSEYCGNLSYCSLVQFS